MHFEAQDLMKSCEKLPLMSLAQLLMMALLLLRVDPVDAKCPKVPHPKVTSETASLLAW